MSNIKLIETNQVSSTPPLKSTENIQFSENSREYRSQIIHSNLPMGESTITHQG